LYSFRAIEQEWSKNVGLWTRIGSCGARMGSYGARMESYGLCNKNRSYVKVFYNKTTVFLYNFQVNFNSLILKFTKVFDITLV